ncbi:MAG: glycoside hydrolase [Actinomycetota bacterium]|nr:exo-alpha-sialidase [Euzebyaceae bacterium]MDQ3451845.1 glycoside hydrolase [Actinomycetota bacterium]
MRNGRGNYDFAYAGLGALINFATATSADGGRQITASPISESVPGVDRQWNVFSSDDTVFLSYNQVFPRAITVQKSTDAGLTYGTPRVISPNPSFPGPIRALPPSDNPTNNGKPVVYYPWTQGNNVRLAVSLNEGRNWNNCTAATTQGEPGVLFPVADHDRDGNIYLVYGDEADFKIRMTTLRVGRLPNCNGGTDAGNPRLKDNPGFTAPVVVDRDKVRTAVFPWIAAGGAPGRVAVAFYGTETSGRADSPSPKTWNVYVNQSLNALSSDRTFSQVKATTHPNHYDQICLFGLACSTGGDRSLVDFFAIDYNPENGEVAVVYNRAHKRPGDAAGLVSSSIVFHQIAGPSNKGGNVRRNEPAAVRTSSNDPTGDALSDYSSLFPAGPKGTRNNVPAADFVSHKIGAQKDFGTDPDGGFTVTMKLDDLSNTALTTALAETNPPSGSLLWIFRFVDGYRYAAASARWNPAQGFSYGFNGYVGSGGECGSAQTPNDGDQCLYYPGNTPLQGRVNQEAGTIEISVPRRLLTELVGSQGPGRTPDEIPARPGARIYTAAAFSVGNASPAPGVQSFLLPLDNTPAMDFRLPR